MKLVKLSCPNCDAKLEVNSEIKKITCNYCGTTTMLDDESIKLKISGTVKISKLKNQIQDLKDLFDNGNIDDTLAEAERLHALYPTNDEILDILTKTTYLKAQRDIQEKEKKDSELNKQREINKNYRNFWILVILLFIFIPSLLLISGFISEISHKNAINKTANDLFYILRKNELFKDYTFENYYFESFSDIHVFEYKYNNNSLVFHISDGNIFSSVYLHCYDIEEKCLKSNILLVEALGYNNINYNDFYFDQNENYKKYLDIIGGKCRGQNDCFIELNNGLRFEYRFDDLFSVHLP